VRKGQIDEGPGTFRQRQKEGRRDETVSHWEEPAWSSFIPGEKSVGHNATCACDRRRAEPDRQLPSDARFGDSIPGPHIRKSMLDTFLLNDRTHSSCRLPNSRFESAIHGNIAVTVCSNLCRNCDSISKLLFVIRASLAAWLQ
jgi:hypothetical protein